LLHRADQGDPSAWEQILSRYSGVVWATVRSFRLQHADALDAVQTTWLRLAENLHRIQRPESLGGWLTTTASRECLHILYRAQRVTTVAGTILDAAADPATGPEQQVIVGHTVHMLWQLIATLPPRQRQLLQELFSDEPPSYTELAARIDIPVGSIGPIRHRALGRIRRMLQDHDPGS
jgi:RNA polymerase sigma factor (sigma-70 family)